MVVLKNTPENKGIFNLRSLFYMTVKIERYKSNAPAQCYNCQQFGHSSLHCGASPRCVKCAGKHKAKDCTKPLEVKPKCTNCNGDHTANYKKCPAITQESEKRRSLKPKILNQLTHAKIQPQIQNNATDSSNQNISHPNTSYAEHTKPKVNKSISELQNLVVNISSENNDAKTIINTIVALLPLLLNLLNQI